MALTITVDKRLDVTVEGDIYPTVILGLTAKDADAPEQVYELVQNGFLTEIGVAVRPYGLVVIPNKSGTTGIQFICKNVVTGEEIQMTGTNVAALVQGAEIDAQ